MLDYLSPQHRLFHAGAADAGQSCGVHPCTRSNKLKADR